MDKLKGMVARRVERSLKEEQLKMEEKSKRYKEEMEAEKMSTSTSFSKNSVSMLHDLLVEENHTTTSVYLSFPLTLKPPQNQVNLNPPEHPVNLNPPGNDDPMNVDPNEEPMNVDPNFRMNWLAVRPKVDSDVEFEEDVVATNNVIVLRDTLGNDLTCSGCAMWERTIIVAGGKNHQGNSNKVTTYNTLENTINPDYPSMKRKRGESPAVVVVGEKVYVFGGTNVTDNDDVEIDVEDTLFYDTDAFDNVVASDFIRQKKVWAEYSILSEETPEWNYLPPSHRLPVGQMLFKVIGAPVVYAEKRCIIFNGTHTFYYEEGKWEHFQVYRPIRVYPWSRSVVILRNFIFWHNEGVIYAHDLSEDLTLSMFELGALPMPAKDLPKFEAVYGRSSLPSFMLYLGNGKMGLFFVRNDSEIWYNTFKINIDDDAKVLSISANALGANIIKTAEENQLMGHIENAVECSTLVE